MELRDGFAMLMAPEYLPPKHPMIMPDGDGNRAMLSEQDPAILSLDFRGVIGWGFDK